MPAARTLTVTYPSPTELRIQRTFDAPRRLVWEAHTKPEYLRQWLLGYDGWSMPVCEFDAREGGAYRYEWLNDATGERMAMGGTIREFVPIERIVATERFDEAWYPGECVNTSEFAEASGGAQTTLTVTSRWESEDALKAATGTDMLEGMEFTYDRLAGFLGQLLADAADPTALDITYDVVELPEQRIARLRGRLGDAQANWGQTYEIAQAAGLLGQPGVVTASVLPNGTGAAGAGAGPGLDMEYDTALTLPAGVPIPAGLTEDRIPAGRYARATYTGPFEGLAMAWGAFTGPGLATLRATMTSGPAFEVYRSSGEDGSPPVTELHVPIA